MLLAWLNKYLHVNYKYAHIFVVFEFVNGVETVVNTINKINKLYEFF